MNLWNIFPRSVENLLDIESIIFLPLISLAFYLFCIYAFVRQAQHRIMLGSFFVLTLMASMTMFFSMGPRIGLIFPPLMLLVVMLMPSVMLLLHVWQKDRVGIKTWGMACAAGWLHSLSWLLLLLALAGS